MKKIHLSEISFIVLLTIGLVILKILGVIHWSWLWVLSPLWLSFGFVCIITILVIIAYIIYIFINVKKDRF